MRTSIPIDYSAINLYQGTRAPTGLVIRSEAGAYFWRSLYQRLVSTITFDLPEDWEKNYFKNVLFGLGFIGIIETPLYGVIPQFCTLSGYGLYRQPTDLLVASPLVTFKGTIGTDCELIRLTPDYIGVCDIIDHYADEIANAYGAFNMALENSKLATLFFPRNQAAAQSLKGIMEKISAGEARLFADKLLKEDITDSSGDSIFTYTTHAKENYLVDRLLQDMREIVTEFDREIGIPSIPDKRERYTDSEIKHVIAGNAARLSLWSECLDETIERVNKHWPDLNLTFKTVADLVVTDDTGADPEGEEVNTNV